MSMQQNADDPATTQRQPEGQSQNAVSVVSEITASQEAMNQLGSALAGPLISSLQAAGLVPTLGQPQQFPAQTNAGPGSAQYFGFNPALTMAQLYGGGTRNLGGGPRRVSQFSLEILVRETAGCNPWP